MACFFLSFFFFLSPSTAQVDETVFCFSFLNSTSDLIACPVFLSVPFPRTWKTCSGTLKKKKKKLHGNIDCVFDDIKRNVFVLIAGRA